MEEQERVMQWKFWLEGVLIPAVGLPGFLGKDHDAGDEGGDDGDDCHGKGSDDGDDEVSAGDNGHGGEVKMMMS